MARSVVDRAVVVRSRYYWPDVQLNLWTLTMLTTSGILLGIFAAFMSQQITLKLSIPWIMPFGITVGALTIIMILVELILIMQMRLMPGLMMLWAFILLVLYLAGLIETGIQVFGNGKIQSYCNSSVFNNKYTGTSIYTLAWLEQNSICQCWQTAFAFWLIGVVFLIYMMIMANQVRQNWYD